MKPLLNLTIPIILLSTGSAYADSFVMIRDGREYICTSTEPRKSEDVVECVTEAYRGPFSKEESMQICEGATSTAPATCAINAYQGPFSRTEAMDLCQRATSNGPSDCAIEAYSGPFSKEESLQLCKRGGTLANAECAIKAYRGPYSKEESIRLCRAEPVLLIRSLNLMESSSDVQSKIRLFKAKIQRLFE